MDERGGAYHNRRGTYVKSEGGAVRARRPVPCQDVTEANEAAELVEQGWSHDFDPSAIAAVAVPPQGIPWTNGNLSDLCRTWTERRYCIEAALESE